MFYKEGIIDTIEYTEYGSNAKPGGLARDGAGNYIAFESDPRGLFLFWGTDSSLTECLATLDDVYKSPLSTASSDSQLILKGTDLELDIPNVEVLQNERATLARGSSGDLISPLKRIDPVQIILARLAFQGVELTWRMPGPRFDDSDVIMAECGLYGESLDLNRARSLAERTADSEFMSRVRLRILQRKWGHVKQSQF